MSASVVFIDFPFVDSAKAKRRPALLLADAGDGDVLLARITGRPSVSPFDLNLLDWQTAGLLQPSVVQLRKLATVSGARIRRTLGSLSERDSESVRTMWPATLGWDYLV